MVPPGGGRAGREGAGVRSARREGGRAEGGAERCEQGGRAAERPRSTRVPCPVLRSTPPPRPAAVGARRADLCGGAGGSASGRGRGGAGAGGRRSGPARPRPMSMSANTMIFMILGASIVMVSGGASRAPAPPTRSRLPRQRAACRLPPPAPCLRAREACAPPARPALPHPPPALPIPGCLAHPHPRPALPHARRAGPHLGAPARPAPWL